MHGVMVATSAPHVRSDEMVLRITCAIKELDDNRRNSDMLLYAETTIEVSHCISRPIAERDRIHGHSYWVRVHILTEVKNPVPVETLRKDLKKIAESCFIFSKSRMRFLLGVRQIALECLLHLLKYAEDFTRGWCKAILRVLHIA